MWFGLAAIALVGAVALLYIDRSRRDQVGRVRQMWAKAQGYTYSSYDEAIVLQFGRAALAKPEHTTAVDLVRGVRRGEKFVLFDVEETATIVAVQRPVGSGVDIDLRLKSTPPPREADMELLGSIGPRVVFATDIDVARRVCDQRMAAFTESVPANLALIWSENDWTLGSLPLGSTGRDWDSAIDAVARLSGMLHVLPPAAGSSSRSARASAPPQERRGRQNLGNDDGRRRDTGSARPPEPSRDAPRRDTSGRDTSGRDTAGRDAPRRDAPTRDTPSRNVPGREVPGREGPGREGSGPDGRRPDVRPPLRSAPDLSAPGSRPAPRQSPVSRAEPPSRPTPINRRPSDS